jgi:DNA-binding MarR family transcriptional regulator
MTATDRHPRHELDELFTNGVRLSIAAALNAVDRADFALIRDLVEITSPALSKHVATLETAGYLEVTKGRIGRQPRTRLRLTESGRDAYRRHMSVLQRIAQLPVPSE